MIQNYYFKFLRVLSAFTKSLRALLGLKTLQGRVVCAFDAITAVMRLNYVQYDSPEAAILQNFYFLSIWTRFSRRNPLELGLRETLHGEQS